MRIRIARLAVLTAVLMTTGLSVYPAFADDTPAAQAAPAAPHSWPDDQKLEKTVWDDIGSGGILAVKLHVADIEFALANAKKTMASAASPDGSTAYVFTDGPADTLMALVVKPSDISPNVKQVVAVSNPYPMLGLSLGSYYNEIGQFNDAVRVLDEGIAASSVLTDGMGMGVHVPEMLGEKGAALIALKRWDDAIASYDAGLKMRSDNNHVRGVLFRGKGYALTELNRLDDAEAAYFESLKLEPGNERAKHELEYIGGLRAGHAPSQGSLYPVQPQGTPPTTQPASWPLQPLQPQATPSTPPPSQPADTSPH